MLKIYQVKLHSNVNAQGCMWLYVVWSHMYVYVCMCACDNNKSRIFLFAISCTYINHSAKLTKLNTTITSQINETIKCKDTCINKNKMKSKNNKAAAMCEKFMFLLFNKLCGE